MDPVGGKLKSFLVPDLDDAMRRQLGEPAQQASLATGVESSLAEERYPVEFSATAGEYFRIWIVNLGLTIATLGIYSAWAKVRKRRYLYSHTRIGGEGFEYRADPIPILNGRLVAVALLVILFAAGNFIPFFAAAPLLRRLAFVVVAAIAGPWFLVRSLKFNAYNSAYRNIRLHFVATYGACLKVVLAYWWVLLLPIAYPYFKRRLVHFAAENHFYGTTRFNVLDFKKPFIHAYAVGFGLFFLAGLGLVLSGVMFGKNEMASGLSLLGFYFAALLIYAYIRVGATNAVWNSIRIGTVRFTSQLRARDLMWIYASNLLVILLSLTLATPWAVVRTYRYRASKTTLIAAGSFDGFVQAETQQVSATGEEVGEMFDIDLAL